MNSPSSPSTSSSCSRPQVSVRRRRALGPESSAIAVPPSSGAAGVAGPGGLSSEDHGSSPRAAAPCAEGLGGASEPEPRPAQASAGRGDARGAGAGVTRAERGRPRLRSAPLGPARAVSAAGGKRHSLGRSGVPGAARGAGVRGGCGVGAEEEASLGDRAWIPPPRGGENGRAPQGTATASGPSFINRAVGRQGWHEGKKLARKRRLR